MTEGGLKSRLRTLPSSWIKTIKKGLPSVVISGEASNPRKGSPFLGSMHTSVLTTEIVY